MATNLVPAFCPEASGPTFFTLVSSLSQLLQASVGKRPTKQPGKDEMAGESLSRAQSAEQMRVGHVPEPRGEEAPDKAHPSHTPASSAPSLLLTWGTGSWPELSLWVSRTFPFPERESVNYDHSQHHLERIMKQSLLKTRDKCVNVPRPTELYTLKG